jgi:hypothetical protein
MTHSFVLFLLIVGLGTRALRGQAREWELTQKLNLAPYLAEAGFDLNSAESLIQATRHDQLGVRAAAVYGLRKLPPTAETLAALRRILKDPKDVMLVYACQSLEELKDTSWVKRRRGTPWIVRTV